MNQYTFDAVAVEADRLASAGTASGASGGVLTLSGETGAVSYEEYDDDGDGGALRALITSMIGEAASQEPSDEGVPASALGDDGVTLEPDRTQFSRAVYRSNLEESRRVGTRLTAGGED